MSKDEKRELRERIFSLQTAIGAISRVQQRRTVIRSIAVHGSVSRLLCRVVAASSQRVRLIPTATITQFIANPFFERQLVALRQCRTKRLPEFFAYHETKCWQPEMS